MFFRFCTSAAFFTFINDMLEAKMSRAPTAMHAKRVYT
jgi:hypothetical protein